MQSVTKKLTNEELEELKSIQSKYLELTAQLGQLHLKKLSLLNTLKTTEEELEVLASVYKSLEQEEVKIQESFTKKYGNGSVNLETGEFTVEV